MLQVWTTCFMEWFMGQIDVNKIFVLTFGCYLFVTLAQIQASPAHAHGFMELALRRLANLDLHPVPVADTEQNPSFAALAFQP